MWYRGFKVKNKPCNMHTKEVESPSFAKGDIVCLKKLGIGVRGIAQ
jgi:hypothetical protein